MVWKLLPTPMSSASSAPRARLVDEKVDSDFLVITRAVVGHRKHVFPLALVFRSVIRFEA
mgnify:CR=1 FL=1